MGELTPLAVIAPGLQVAVNPVIALPPLLAGGANEMDALELPAVTLPMIGAPGALADTVKLCATGTAALKSILPNWLAVMVQLPTVITVTTAPETLQTAGVMEVYVRGSADDAEAFVMLNGDAFNVCPAMVPKVIVCGRLATIRLKFCVPFVGLPFDTEMVNGYVPADPDCGVPASTPAVVNDNPAGKAPTAVNVNGGVPDAVTLNMPAVATVKMVVAALVITGGFTRFNVREGSAAPELPAPPQVGSGGVFTSMLNSDAGERPMT